MLHGRFRGLGLALALALVWPTAPLHATPPVHPREGLLAEISAGSPERGRAYLRRNVETLQRQWRAVEDTGPRGLEHRVGIVASLAALLERWWRAEALGLQARPGTDPGAALVILGEFLPLARELLDARSKQRAEAEALEPTLTPMERRREYAGIFLTVRWRAEIERGLPESAARLARRSGSAPHVRGVFFAFSSPIGGFADPDVFLRSDEDFRIPTRAEDKPAILDLLRRYFAALRDQDAERMRACLSPRLLEHTEAILGRRQVLAPDDVDKLTLFDGRPGGLVRVRLVKRRFGWKGLVTRHHDFTVIRELDSWRIEALSL